MNPPGPAKERFNELLERCLTKGPQMLTRCGTEMAVLVSAAEWRRLQAAARPSLKQLLLLESARSTPMDRARGISKRRPTTGL
jgi:antitoxin Phd